MLAVALAGIASHKNFIVIMLGIELIFAASTMALLAFFSYATADPSAIFLLFSIWAVASAEIITVIAFYVFMRSRGFDFDVSKLSRLKW